MLNVQHVVGHGCLACGSESVDEQVERRIANGMGQVESIVAKYGACPMSGTMVGIDLETTGISTNQDYIIDAGWELYDMATGRISDAQRHTYDLSASSKASAGILTELTGITTADVAGHIPF